MRVSWAVTSGVAAAEEPRLQTLAQRLNGSRSLVEMDSSPSNSSKSVSWEKPKKLSKRTRSEPGSPAKFTFAPTSNRPSSASCLRRESTVVRNELLLQEACMKNNLIAVKRLLEMKVDVNCRSTSQLDFTPLHWAVSHGHMEILELLINAKCDVEAVDKHGTKALLIAASLGNKEAIRLLIKAGASMNAVNKHRQGILHIATLNRCLDVINYVLEFFENVDVNAVDKNQQTALHIATELELLDIVVKLVNSGCNVTAQNKHGQTALHIAAGKGNMEIIQYLLTTGQGLNMADEDGKAAIHVATEIGHLHVVEVLLASGVDPHAQIMMKGWTPLHVAARKGHSKITEALIRYDADIHTEDKHGNTALHLAAATNSIETVQILLDRGADINAVNIRKQTPLHVASEEGHAELVQMFLKITRLDVCKRDKTGKTPLAVAARGSFTTIVDLIIQYERAQQNEVKIEECNLNEKSSLHNAQNDTLSARKLSVKHENLKHILWRLAAKELGPGDWKRLAYHWKFTDEQVKAIEHQYTGTASHKEHGYRLLLIWVSELKSDQHVVRELFEALVAVDLSVAAENIRAEAGRQSNDKSTRNRRLCKQCHLL